MPELGPYGSVRGARGNSRPYRESRRDPVKPMRMPAADIQSGANHQVQCKRIRLWSAMMQSLARAFSAVQGHRLKAIGPTGLISTIDTSPAEAFRSGR
jgi:hypothetical protein